jgi:hypothetical protein
MSKDIYTVPVPEWAFGYIFNCDRDNITPDEERMIDDFMSDIEAINPPNGEPYFDAFPLFGLPCNVADCEVIYKEVKQ